MLKLSPKIDVETNILLTQRHGLAVKEGRNKSKAEVNAELTKRKPGWRMWQRWRQCGTKEAELQKGEEVMNASIQTNGAKAVSS